MKTLAVDDQNRIRIPEASPRQVFTDEANPDGSILLLPVEARTKEAFPPGSLLHLIDREYDREAREIMSELPPVIPPE